MRKQNKTMLILLFFISTITIGPISCSNTILPGTNWKYIESISENDSLFRNRNIEIEFVTSNKIVLKDECNESNFSYRAMKNGFIRVDSYLLVKDCKAVAMNIMINSKIVDAISDAAKYKIKGDTLLIFSRSENRLSKFTFIRKM